MLIKNINNINKIYVISRVKLTNDANWISEDEFPFTLEDICKIIGKHRKTCWYYAGLLKMNIHCIDYLEENILVLDCDTLFIKPISFLDKDNKALFNISQTDGTEFYNEHIKLLMPKLKKQHKHSGVVHNILMNKTILKSFANDIENKYKKPFWKADLETACKDYINLSKDKLYRKNRFCGPGRRATYELYFTYALQYFPNKCKVRPLNSIMAYKGKIPAPNMLNESYPSRTNLKGNIQIISKDEENKLSFKTVEKAIIYISEICEEKGYDTVTFQNHTRVGSSRNSEINVNYVNKL